MAKILLINPHMDDLSTIDELSVVRGGFIVKPHVQKMADALEVTLGATSFGTYPSHSPPEGPTQAIDVFNADTQNGHMLQDRICAYVRANAKRFGVRYCIRREHIWNIERDNEGFRRQKHQGDRTADHYDHVHITFYATAVGPLTPKVEPEAPKLTQKELLAMDFMYQHAGEDYIFLASIRYFGKLPFGETLDELAEAKLVHNFGKQTPAFHKGVQALADAAGMRGITLA